MQTINLGKLVIPVIVPQKGVDYYTAAEKQEFITEITNNINEIIEPQEEIRQNNETAREEAEEQRQNNETARQNNEVTRQNAETLRNIEETARQTGETNRQSAFNAQMQAVDNAIADIQDKTTAYNNNAINKTNEFNTNAINKTTAFNENATAKTAEFDEHVEEFQEQLDDKVEKEAGKGLSTNDYTNEEKGKVDSNTQARHTHTNKTILDNTTASFTTEQKGKLEGLDNYDDTEIKEDISELQNNTLQILEEEEVEIYD